MGVSRRIKAIIGEKNLLNDATGPVAYNFAVAAVLSGTFSLWSAHLQFVYVSMGEPGSRESIIASKH